MIKNVLSSEEKIECNKKTQLNHKQLLRVKSILQKAIISVDRAISKKNVTEIEIKDIRVHLLKASSITSEVKIDHKSMLTKLNNILKLLLTTTTPTYCKKEKDDKKKGVVISDEVKDGLIRDEKVIYSDYTTKDDKIAASMSFLAQCLDLVLQEGVLLLPKSVQSDFLLVQAVMIFLTTFISTLANDNNHAFRILNVMHEFIGEVLKDYDDEKDSSVNSS